MQLQKKPAEFVFEVCTYLYPNGKEILRFSEFPFFLERDLKPDFR